jgi:hypothetical protein
VGAIRNSAALVDRNRNRSCGESAVYRPDLQCTMSRLRRLHLVIRLRRVVRLRENGTWTRHNLVRSAKLKKSLKNTVQLIR